MDNDRVESGPSRSGKPLMRVDDLTVRFVRRGEEPFTAVDSISLSVQSGRSVGLVGESGCGKSVTSLAIMGLLPRSGSTVNGQVSIDGTPLLELTDAEMNRHRGRDIAMIFQDPLTSLNPVVPVGIQVAEVLERHKKMRRKDALSTAAHQLERVGIPDPTRRLDEYPHQLSGGMRQRVLIATALACEPRMLIADEPTTALDVTVQAQILALLNDLVSETGTALLMITHDLGVVASLCDEINVMYAGRIVERAGRHQLFERPRHPYTSGLLDSVPRLDGTRKQDRLEPIPGSVADNLPWRSGCAFAPRCSHEVEACRVLSPTLAFDRTSDTHVVRCHNPVQAGQ